MSPELSLVKITRPRLRNIYPRARLFEHLDKAREFPVIWLSAPPGSGKTTVINSYIEQRELLCLWYQVDERDSDAATLFHYLNLSADVATNNTHNNLPHLTAEYRMGLPAFTRTYFETLYQQLQTPSILVFDNTQTVPDDSLLQQILSIGLSEIPEGTNVVIISRCDPPPVFMRLLANNLMTIIKADDLALTLDEAQGLAAARDSHINSTEVIKTLLDKTKGWVTGFVFALDKLQYYELADITDSTPKVIFDYFGAEIFNKFNKQTQTVLLKSAFLPKITHRTIDVLTGVDNSADVLIEFSNNNYFIDVHSGSEPYYEYHPLFREFLLSRAKNVFTVDQLQDLQYQAALILKDNNQIEEAINLFLQIENWYDAVDTILSCAKTLITQGRYNILESWIKRIPVIHAEKNAWLLYWYGVSQIISSPTSSYHCFIQAYALFKKENDITGQLETSSTAIEAIFYENIDYSNMDRWIKNINELTPQYNEINDLETRALIAKNMLLALVWRQPQHETINYWVECCTALWIYASNAIIRSQLFLNLAMYHLYVGEFIKCENILIFAKQLVQLKHAPPLSVITTHLVTAFYKWCLADSNACEQSIKAGLILSESSGIRIFDGHLISYGAYNALSTGKIHKAEEFIQQLANTLSDKPNNLDHGRLQMLVAWLNLLTNDLTKATDAIEQSVNITVRSGAIWPEYTCRNGYAQILFEKGLHKEAYAQIKLARSIGGILNSPRADYECSIIESYFALRQNNMHLCLDRLTHAFSLASKLGFMQMYFWRPQVMSELSIVALNNNIEINYTRSLIHSRKLKPKNPPHEILNWPWVVKIQTLGKFEVLINGHSIKGLLNQKAKLVDMLMILIAFGGKVVSEQKISDALWPDVDGDQAQQNFKTTLHRLRKLFGDNDVLLLKNHKLSLDDSYCWLDIWSVSRQVTEINRIKSDSDNIQKLDQLANQLINAYPGYFLDNETQSWAIDARERLHTNIKKHLLLAALQLENNERIESAINCYQKVMNIDPQTEESYQGLMRCYIKRDQQASAKATYQLCKKVLDEKLNAVPSEATEAVYAMIGAIIKKH